MGSHMPAKRAAGSFRLSSPWHLPRMMPAPPGQGSVRSPIRCGPRFESWWWCWTKRDVFAVTAPRYHPYVPRSGSGYGYPATGCTERESAQGPAVGREPVQHYQCRCHTRETRPVCHRLSQCMGGLRSQPASPSAPFFYTLTLKLLSHKSSDI